MPRGRLASQVALFLAWGGVDDAAAMRWVHVAGLTWLALCGAVLWQAAAGWAPMSLTSALIVAAVLFAGWAGVALVAARRWVGAVAT